MSRLLPFNPARVPVEELAAITCGENRLAILDQLVTALRAEIGRPNHQHHLLIGPRGAGKTHLLRLLTADRIANDPQLREAYLPVVMPEETALRSPADLFLKIVVRLEELLKKPPAFLSAETVRTVRALCRNDLAKVKNIRDPKERLDSMAHCLQTASTKLDRILLPVAENMDQTLYLGSQRTRKGPAEEHWALRRHLQQAPHILLIAAAPSWFGAVGDSGKPFYDFFRCHQLGELSDEEMLEIINRRLGEESTHPGPDEERAIRVRCLRDHQPKTTAHMRGLLALIGYLPRFAHLIYEVMVESDVTQVLGTLNSFLDEMTPYFQQRLDPRFIPQAEIDLLHTLAMARGPMRPKELADQLYGVPINEVSELLGRLKERGLVKRAGQPGGRAVTWDLTEPLFRVWTQFRDNPAGQEATLLLAEFVIIFFSPIEIRSECDRLSQELACLHPEDPLRQRIAPRLELLHSANKLITPPEPETMIPFPGSEKANELLKYSGEEGEQVKYVNLDELRRLATEKNDEPPLREKLAKALVNAINDAVKAQDRQTIDTLLKELRGLAFNHPDEPKLREKLAEGLVKQFCACCKSLDQKNTSTMLEELRSLTKKYPNEKALRDWLARGFIHAIVEDKETQDYNNSTNPLDELRALTVAYPKEPMLYNALVRGIGITAEKFAQKNDWSNAKIAIEDLLNAAEAIPNEDVIEILKEVMKDYCIALLGRMKAGEKETAIEEFQWLWARMPEHLTKLLRPTELALEVLDKGEELALAHEPEEVRRVVRMVLERINTPDSNSR